MAVDDTECSIRVLSDEPRIVRSIARAGTAASSYMPDPLACSNAVDLEYVCALPLSLDRLLQSSKMSLNRKYKWPSVNSNRHPPDGSDPDQLGENGIEVGRHRLSDLT